MHPDIELVEWPESPDSRHGHGVAEVTALRDAWFEAWDSLEFEIDEYLESDTRVVTCGRARARGKGGAVPVEFESYTVFTVCDGKVARMEFFIAREAALVAAGLTGAGAE